MNLQLLSFIAVFSWLKYITVELSVLFFFTTYTILDFLNTNLYLRKTCLNYTSEPDFSIPCNDEKQGISYVASINATCEYVVMTCMFLLSILLSSWSDVRKRRKPLLLLPIIGQLFQCASNALQSYFWYWSPLIAVISDTVVKSLAGGNILFLLGAQIYLCDVTSLKDRSTRLGIFTALKMICLPLGSGMAGFLMHGIGFFYSYVICFVLTLIALIFTIVLVKDLSATRLNLSVLELFNLKQMFSAFKVTFKKKEGHGRLVVILMILTHVLTWFSSFGERSVFYLYMRYRFKWDEKTYSVYAAYKFIGLIIGTISCTIILSGILKVHDSLVGLFAAFWDTLTVIAYLFANQTWQLYLIPLLDIFHGVAISICDSFLSKFFEIDEFGRMNSIIHIFSLIVPLCNPVYNGVFQLTMDSFPAAHFMISIVIDVVVCVLYGTAYHYSKT